MTNQQFHATHSLRSRPLSESDSYTEHGVVTVPYAGQTRMRLTIASGIADAQVRIDPDATDLIAVEYGEDVPLRLRVTSTELRLSWPTTLWSWLNAALDGGDHDVAVVLHPAVEWTLQFRGGLSHVEADLAEGKVARLEISGGICNADFALPRAPGVVPFMVSGGVCNLVLRRPAESGIALAVGGGIADLRLDDQSFQAIGGSSHLAAGSIHGDTSRYDVQIGGGASGLQIVHR